MARAPQVANWVVSVWQWSFLNKPAPTSTRTGKAIHYYNYHTMATQNSLISYSKFQKPWNLSWMLVCVQLAVHPSPLMFLLSTSKLDTTKGGIIWWQTVTTMATTSFRCYGLFCAQLSYYLDVRLIVVRISNQFWLSAIPAEVVGGSKLCCYHY